MDKLKKYLFYAGIEEQQYQRIRPLILKSNIKMLEKYINCCTLFLIPVIFSVFLSETVRRGWVIYFGAFAGCLLLQVMRHVMNQSSERSMWLLVNLFDALLFGLSILIGTVVFPASPAITFMAFLMVVPPLFAIRPIFSWLMLLFYDAIFLMLSFLFKSNALFYRDLLNTVIFTLVSCNISTYQTKRTHESFVLRDDMQRMIDYDLTTGLKSRNAFEYEQEEYAKNSKKCIACIYIDVNGLHELNNSKGHDAGDQMLREVGKKMHTYFGESNCYRIGGDEFVAFLSDKPGKEIRQMMQEFRTAIEASGYSVAIGMAHQSIETIDSNLLRKEAERQMYLDKEQYYRVHGRTR